MIFIWNEILFRPLLNLLIFLYDTVGMQNLGLAIIFLTITIRLILLPFNIKDQKRLLKEKKLKNEVAELSKAYANNPIILKEEIKKTLKEYKFGRWSKIILLGVQALVLIVLYQVFIGGINVQELVDIIYSGIKIPVSINTYFLGIDIAEKSFIMSFIAGIILFTNILIDYKISPVKKNIDLLYFIGFPIATFLVLWILPAVKALFIITSMIFSDLVWFIMAFHKSITEQDIKTKTDEVEKMHMEQSGLTHPKDRFN